MEYDDTRFQSAMAGLGVLGCLLAAATPLLSGTGAAFTGSIVTSGLLGLAFAARNAQVFRAAGRPGLAPATLTTVFGGWFMLAPLLYTRPGFLATAGTQFAGLLAASGGGYLALVALEGEG